MLFGDRLKILREEKEVTQKELGRAIGVSDRVIGYYESNDRFPKDESVLRNIADFFSVSVDYLLGRTTNRNGASDNKLNVNELKLPEEIMKEMTLFFMNGEIAEKDKEKVMRDIQDLYWKAKDKFSEDNK